MIFKNLIIKSAISCGLLISNTTILFFILMSESVATATILSSDSHNKPFLFADFVSIKLNFWKFFSFEAFH